MAKRSSSFAEFWHHYLQGHAHAGTRALHYLGTVIAGIGILVGLLTLNPWLAFFGIFSAYVLAWLGHFFIEHNRPSVLQHPLWSFLGDVRMLCLWIAGRLNAQLRRAGLPIAER